MNQTDFRPATIEEARRAGALCGERLYIDLAEELRQPAPTPEDIERIRDAGALGGERLFKTGESWGVLSLTSAMREAVEEARANGEPAA